MKIQCLTCDYDYDSSLGSCPRCRPGEDRIAQILNAPEETPPLSPAGSAEFPAIEVEEFNTANHPGADRVAIMFTSGPMSSALIFTPELARELLASLERTLARLEERKRDIMT